MVFSLSSVYNFSKTMSFFLPNFYTVNITFFKLENTPPGFLIFVSGILLLLSDVL